MIPAIQTHFDLHHFRSRSEARWAVFFDAMNWQFQYEPEGFALPFGPYLPDFFLPQLQCYFEVKPSEKPKHDPKYGVQDRSQILAEELALATGKPCLIVYGTPYDLWNYPGMTFLAEGTGELNFDHDDFRLGLGAHGARYRSAVKAATSKRF